MINQKPKKKLPRDANQLAKTIVDIATGSVPPEPQENAKAVAGRKGGVKGGKARADAISQEKRSEIAKKAAAARWKKS